jgi:hypothetical protein
MNAIIKQIIIFSFAALSCNAYSAEENSSKEPVSACAKIDTGAITDVLDASKIKYSKNDSYLLFTSNPDGSNYTTGDDRLTIDGHVYISNDSILALETLTVARMEDNKPTDEVTYFSKKNKILGGLFYNDVTNDGGVGERFVYIGTAGDVYHLKKYALTDKECLGHFPKDILKKVSLD